MKRYFPAIINRLIIALLLGGQLGPLWPRPAGAAAQPNLTPPHQATAVVRAVDWLVTQRQNEDGGYTSFSGGADDAPADIGGTLDAILAIAAAGYDPAIPHPAAGATPIDYLRANAADLAAYAGQSGGQAGKLLLALTAANQPPRTFAGQDFVALLAGQANAEGAYNVATQFEQALALLGLAAAGETAPDMALLWLSERQAASGPFDGSWDDGYGTQGNTDSTAMAIMALLAHGVPAFDPRIEQALAFLAQAQLPTGGWPYAPDFGESANSTALAIQALRAAGIPVDEVGGWAPAGVAPLPALLAWQGESGAFQADFGDGRADDFYATIQALPAAMGLPFPLPARHQAARRALDCLATLQEPASGGWPAFAGGEVDAGGTARAILALTALGQDPAGPDWTPGEQSAAAALEQLALAYLDGARGGRLGLVLSAVVASGGDPAAFAGRDLVAALTAVISPTGELDDTAFGPFGHARGLIGLIDAGAPPPPAAVSWLQAAQTGGDWGGPDGSGIAVQALGRLGLVEPAMVAALRAAQLPDGGWGYEGSNPSSTAEVVQGLVLAGENPFDPSWRVPISGTLAGPAEPILAAQQANGCWPNQFGPGDDPFSTVDALRLLAQRPSTWGVTPALLVEPRTAPAATPEPAAPIAAPPTEPAATESAAAEPAVEPSPRPTESPAAAPAAAESAGGLGGFVSWLIVIAVIGAAVGLGIYYGRRNNRPASQDAE